MNDEQSSNERLLRQALKHMQALCAGSERCELDVRIKLTRMGLEIADIDAVVDSLRRDRFIDDKRYACAYASDKFRFNGWGPVKLRQMLQAKRLPADIIDMAVGEIADESFRMTLTHLLNIKSETLKPDLDFQQRRLKLTKYGVGRGFDIDMVHEVVGEILA